jgi:phage virion morphogenesis protein
MTSWQGLERMLARITRIERALRAPGQLKRAIGRKLVEQTRRRIQVEKTDPDGNPWEKWSTDYAATRGAAHSLLIDSGDLLKSIKASVTKDGVSVTSDRDYALAVHAERPFLGVSDSNSDEISELMHDWMKRTL